ncbi:MAG: hypothetical protein ACRBFS_27060 [Aureispira sp.]
MARYLFLLLITITIAFIGKACSCKTDASGVVLDAKTLEPLEGVRVRIALANIHGDTLDQPTITNAEGYFECTHFYCSKYQLNFFKENYIAHTKDPALQDTILLELLEDL